MTILLDTNVILDLLLEREETDAALDVMSLADEDLAVEIMTASSVTDVFYMLTSNKVEKKLDSKVAQGKISDLLELVDVAPVTKNEITEALSLAWDDFEDAVQYVVAKANGVDYIITRDGEGFKSSDIPVLTPREFLQTIKEEEAE